MNGYPSPRSAWYVVGVLTFVYIFSFIDRQILNLMVGPIRRDLDISDTGMSLLMGFSFAVFYTLFGIPLGRMADTQSRRTIIAAGFALWSLFTAGCGVVRNFAGMLLMRMGVGVGEASLSPAAYSLITDYFPPHRRATAMGVYGMGIYIGSGMAFLLGGLVTGFATKQESWNLPLIGATRGWQLIFFAVGLPGLALAMLMYTVREPIRRGLKKGGSRLPLREVAAYIRENKTTFLCHNFGISLLSFSSYGSAAWIPTFFVRVHGWSAARTGIIYGLIVMTFGALGIAAGGRFADFLAERGYRDANFRVAFLVSLIWMPTGIAYLLVPDPVWAMALLAPTVFTVAAPFGIAPAAITQIMPNQMRGQAGAIYLFVNNLIGLGLGPTAVAIVTDYVFHDDSKVGYSLLIVGVTAHVLSAIIWRIGLKPYVRSLDRLKTYTEAHG
ncbi:MAG: MFS transporter [Acidobacteria bacterium]|nr:MFS transporter [Acidobacteriota bacterium]